MSTEMKTRASWKPRGARYTAPVRLLICSFLLLLGWMEGCGPILTCGQMAIRGKSPQLEAPSKWVSTHRNESTLYGSAAQKHKSLQPTNAASLTTLHLSNEPLERARSYGLACKHASKDTKQTPLPPATMVPTRCTDTLQYASDTGVTPTPNTKTQRPKRRPHPQLKDTSSREAAMNSDRGNNDAFNEDENMQEQEQQKVHQPAGTVRVEFGPMDDETSERCSELLEEHNFMSVVYPSAGAAEEEDMRKGLAALAARLTHHTHTYTCCPPATNNHTYLVTSPCPKNVRSYHLQEGWPSITKQNKNTRHVKEPGLHLAVLSALWSYACYWLLYRSMANTVTMSGTESHPQSTPTTESGQHQQQTAKTCTIIDNCIQPPSQHPHSNEDSMKQKKKPRKHKASPNNHSLHNQRAKMNRISRTLTKLIYYTYISPQCQGMYRRAMLRQSRHHWKSATHLFIHQLCAHHPAFTPFRKAAAQARCTKREADVQPKHNATTHTETHTETHTSTCSPQQLGGPTTQPTTKRQRTMHEHGLWFERQTPDRNFCQAHAINNYYGQRKVTGEELLAYCAETARRMAPPDRDAWNTGHDPITGEFSDCTINRYLQEKYNTHTHTICLQVQGADIPAQITQLAQQYNTDAILCRKGNDETRAGHALTLKRHKGTWYILDSLHHTPYVTLVENWTSIAGAQLSVIVTHNHTRPHFYMEKQEKLYCFVHALCMAMQHRITTGAAVLQHCEALQQTYAQRMSTVKALRPAHEVKTRIDFLNKKTGSFSHYSLNHYFHKNPHIYTQPLCLATSRIEQGTTSPHLLTSKLPLATEGRTHALIMGIETGTTSGQPPATL